MRALLAGDRARPDGPIDDRRALSRAETGRTPRPRHARLRPLGMGLDREGVWPCGARRLCRRAHLSLHAEGAARGLRAARLHPRGDALHPPRRADPRLPEALGMNRSPANDDRSIARIVAICSIALLAPLLRPLFTGRVFVYNDLSWFHLPMRYLYQQALRSGDTVLWTPSIFAGLYMHGEGQTGVFHPLHQLLYRLLPLGTAFNLELIASYPIAFGGTFWFLRRLRFSQAAALFGAMLFAFSGFN